MRLVRVDNWTESEDKLLVSTVLDYVRNGKTQIQAFDDVAEKVDRGAAGCGFRWNTVLRKNHEEELRIARRERRQQKLDTPKFEKPVVVVPEVVKNKSVSVDDLAIKEFKGQRVITFKDIDEVHCRPEGTARRNFNHNKKHLIEEEDYFERNPSEAAKEFGIIAPNGLKLLTESGYLMLVKSFTDDLAWEVQRKLIKTYFKVKEVVQGQLQSYLIADPIERAKAWIKEQEEKKQLETEKLLLEQHVADLAPRMTYLDTIIESKDSIIVSQISADYGLSAKALNKILHEAEVQYKRNDQWLLYSQHTGQGFTESRTIPFVKPSGETGTSLQTRWTQKGRLFIHDILTKRGITPLMDR